MPAKRDDSVLRKAVHQNSLMGATKFLSAAAFIGLGAGLFFVWPDEPGESPVASAAANAPEPAADESFCDKQAWPYVDQRCAKRVEAARGTRQVRIVTDKGQSATTVTPLPIVEAKPKPAPASPALAVAQTDRPMGPPVAPVATDSQPQTETVAAAPQPAPAPAPQNPPPKAAAAPAGTVQVTVAPANRPPVTQTVARENPPPPADTRNASAAPSAASTAPMAPGVDAFAEEPKKSKSARAAEKAEKRAAEKAAKREAKRRKPIDEDNSGVPEDVVTAVKSAPSSGQKSRAARKGVPEEVIAAVEEAAAEARGRRGRGTVSIGSPSGGQRIYVVPREAAIPGGL